MRRFRASHGVVLGDALIASLAVERSALLWTANRKHFPMDEVRFFDPDPGPARTPTG